MSIDFDILQSNKINGIYVITPTVSQDARGNIWTSFLKNDVEKLLPEGLIFMHDKFSTSSHNVLRGVHSDTKSWKLITCVYGEIQQVVVDLREGSPTYLEWQEYKINSDNPKLILMPPNIGNAYYVVSDKAVYHYKLAYNGDYIDANDQISVKWNDKKIGINWLSKSPFLSKRDE